MKSHDLVAEVIVNKALKKSRAKLLWPCTIKSGFWLRSMRSDKILCRIVIMAGGGAIMSG